MTRPVRVAVQLYPQHGDYSAMREAVAAAEEMGVDALFTWDHFFPLFGDLEGKHFECWSLLAAWAEQTSRVEIGPLVSCNGFRNADLVADMARTIDHISGGRFILGIGSGWYERDFTDYGYDFGTVGSRLDQLAEDLPRIEARWEALNPPPVRDIPVLIGGGGEQKTLRMVARHADIWHTFAQGEQLTHKLDVLRGHCEQIGRDPREIELSVGVGGPGREGRLPGPPDVEGQPLVDLGARLFTIGIRGPEYDLTIAEPWLAWRDALNADS